VLRDAPGAILGLTLGVMAVKGVILFGLGRLFRLDGHDHWLFTLGLAQAGEFGFVLISFSDQQGVLPGALGQTLLLVIAMSMLATPLFFLLHAWLARRMTGRGADAAPDAIDESRPIIIAGIGRFGQVVNRMLQMSGFRPTVLDNDLGTIQLMRTFGFEGYFGDPTRPELLHAAGLPHARALVVALDDRDAATSLTAYARRERPDLFIITRARDRLHVYDLYRAGADKIVREVFDSSLRAGRYVLEQMGLTAYEAHELEATFYQLDREAVRELADLWDPAIPLEQNEAYIARARALNKDLETALASRARAGIKSDENIDRTPPDAAQ
jgi:CPA2 family monovalent cation:H+ antiporter-2